jgi:N-acetylmuramoyl-L-alanine amidase-like protein
MVEIASRGSWGARYQDGDMNLSGLAQEVFIHHTVTATLPKDASRDDEREQMRALESIGQSRFGTGISYNVIVFPSGRAYQGVSFNRRGTHTGGRNSTVRSISFAGNFEKNTPTAQALATAAQIYAEGKGKWWERDAPLFGHRNVSQTACPGKNLYARLDIIRTGAVEVDNPIKPAPSLPDIDPVTLKTDGLWGSATTRRLQQVLGTPVDGFVSSQPLVWRQSNPGLTTGWDWTMYANGSRVISALQEVLSVSRDGKFGSNSIRAFQRRMGTTVDGELWKESPAIEELQRRLNKGDV